jgi:hypothetical protein
MDFDQTLYILSPQESEILLIFKVIGQRSMSQGLIFNLLKIRPCDLENKQGSRLS